MVRGSVDMIPIPSTYNNVLRVGVVRRPGIQKDGALILDSKQCATFVISTYDEQSLSSNLTNLTL